ncbi:MAG TPA: glycoside hydrolase family 44 protein, partial [Roseiflexaceae bacterium]|nr:glycoside hydrolase family 44 protein [Roseiflexaceae bacterium]
RIDLRSSILDLLQSCEVSRMFSVHRVRTFLLLIVFLGMLTARSEAEQPAATGPALSVNAASVQRAISPYIYGMNFADQALAQELRLPVNRWGGNSTTRYNWQIDVHNTGLDYYYENIPDGNSTTLPNGSSGDKFVEQNRATGTDTLLTIPLIGWTPKQRRDNHPYDCGYPKTQFASQQSFYPYDPNCGNGLTPGGQPVTTSSTAGNTSIAIGPPFVQSWMQHLVGRYGGAGQGGVRFYNLDNEPGLWNSTHRDVHPLHPSYDELTDDGKLYAAAIKAIDPNAQTLGPVQDGWTRYYYASYLEYPDTIAQADRDNHDGKPFVVWYLQQMAAYEQQQGTRLLDYFDLHYYPQTSNVALSPAGDAERQARRLRSVRSLWDPTYVDESWIPSTGEATAVDGVGVDGAVQLIPRMRDWIARNYPGTKLAISEYNWGALDHINGALAQADVLGIFGREGVDLATIWDAPAADEPGAFAFRMYRNYNGQGGAFGELSVSASSADQGQLAIYAARRAVDGGLTLMIINKTGGELTSNVALSGFSPAATAQVYRYSPANLSAIVRQPDQAVSASGFSATFPANSITLVAIASSTPQEKIFVPLTRR